MAPRVSVRIDVIVHATESAAGAAGSFGILGLGAGAFVPRRAEGHFGNRITILEASLGGAEGAGFVRRVARMLPRGQARQAADGIDGSTMHMRLDKQELAGGAVRLAPGGAVRVRVTVPGYAGGARGRLEEILGLD